ncbi:transcriptional activator NhaR [Chromobacterium phragmitis]|uniref:Transcriptional activator NhaR n=1 Tax=Chromobacterium phragmitis TaxID=2202141 RepID=A0A344UF09_9NEIS|nr:transcriptional activator NhaR [Chromobacterium phragmitis]AXE32495.1 transcriptional activator NhaR [Chromobacterium phragmitis]AXE33857.1 transcriptional activator NhaR [Chromobacterium phragmitis]
MQGINYKHLNYFWHVARSGSVTRAAERLGVSMQTISGQITRLEQQLGRALFRQQGRGLALTEAGRLALGYADRIFLLGEEMEEALADARLGQTQRLAAGISDVLPKGIASRLLRPALTAAGHLRLSCSEGDFDELIGELGRHKLDLVLADRPVASSEQQQFQSWPLLRCPVLLLAAPALLERHLPDFPASLRHAPLLMPSRDNVLRRQLEHWFAEQDIRPEVVGEFDDHALMETFARQGLGLLPTPASPDGEADHPGLQRLGALEGVWEHYYVTASRRKLQHASLQAILQAWH